VHHVIPNSVEHDADVQHLPFMAISEEFLGGIFSRYHNDAMACPPAALAMLSQQHRYFFGILTFARYGLLLQGVKTVGWEWGKRNTGFGAPNARWTRLLQAAALACFYGYSAALLARLPSIAERLLFTYLSGATFAILHLQARGCVRVWCVVRAARAMLTHTARRSTCRTGRSASWWAARRAGGWTRSWRRR
jgi:delta8-fatty-acid desaturase